MTELSPEKIAEIHAAANSSFIEFDGPDELHAIENEIHALQAQRAKEKLTAAKTAVDEALYELSSSQHGRDSEVAADAIENLIRVMMEAAK